MGDLKKNKMILSIDIGNSSVKMVQSQLNGEKLEIIKVGSKTIQVDSKKIPESINQSQFAATIIDLYHLPTDEYVKNNLVQKKKLQTVSLGVIQECLKK